MLDIDIDRFLDIEADLLVIVMGWINPESYCKRATAMPPDAGARQRESGRTAHTDNHPRSPWQQHGATTIKPSFSIFFPISLPLTQCLSRSLNTLLNICDLYSRVSKRERVCVCIHVCFLHWAYGALGISYNKTTHRLGRPNGWAQSLCSF